MAINMRVTGRGLSALLTFTHDQRLDVFVFNGATFTGLVINKNRFASWPSVVELLAAHAGVEVPAVVQAARLSRGSELGRAELAEAVKEVPPDGGSLLLEAIAEMVRQVRSMGYTVAGRSAGPIGENIAHRELDLEFKGHERAFGARMRFEPSVAAVVFAGGWEVEELPALRAAPRIWSTWAPFTLRLRQAAEAAASD
jgi:hypothetical protein